MLAYETADNVFCCCCDGLNVGEHQRFVSTGKMLSKLIRASGRTHWKTSLRSASTVATTRRIASYKKSLAFFGSFGSIACYDYFLRDGESLGAALRFMRSTRIALEISIDYNIGLYGLDENSEEYDKVNNDKSSRNICAINTKTFLLENKRNSQAISRTFAQRMFRERWIVH